MFVDLYVATGARRHRRLPPAVHAPRVQDQQVGARRRWPSSARPRSRARSSRGSPTTASTTRSPTARATRTARTSTTGTASRARCRACCTRTWAGCSSTPQRGNKERYAPDLIADPLISWIDRTFVLWVIVGLLVPFLLGWLIGGTLDDRAHRPAVGRRRADARASTTSTYSINSLCHFFGRQRLRHRRRVAQPAVALAASRSASRGTTTTTRSRRRPATASSAWQFDISAGVIWALEKTGPGVGRRAHQPRAPGPQGRPDVAHGGSAHHRAAAAGARRQPPGAPVPRRRSGTAPRCRRRTATAARRCT